jgi:hypothetical protein
MLTNYDPDWNIEDLTDAEIYAAIRYLEPDTSSPDEQKDDGQRDDTPTTRQNVDHGVLICVCLYVAVLVCLAFSWFYFS